MGKRRYTPEEIIKHLRTFEIAQAKGEKMKDLEKKMLALKSSWLNQSLGQSPPLALKQ